MSELGQHSIAKTEMIADSRLSSRLADLLVSTIQRRNPIRSRPFGKVPLRARKQIEPVRVLDRRGTFPNGRLRMGLRLWIVLTSKSARRLESLESAIISVLAIECCPSSLIQPPCEFWHLPMKRGTLYKRTVSSVRAVFSSQALSRPLRAN